MSLEVRDAGDRALLLIPDDPTRVVGLATELRELGLPGVVDLIPAAETVLLTISADADRAALVRACHRAVDRVESAPSEGDNGRIVEIPVHYDGADLNEVARLLGRTTTELIRAHTGQLWRCAFVGFAPGFGYLTSESEPLVVPRRDQARVSVPTGAVALADGYSAIYPRQSPGGWQLIGTTTAAMWELTRDEPALLTPGDRVRFIEVPR